VKLFLGAVAGLVLVVVTPFPAFANTAPNPYTPHGAAWIDVPDAQKVQLESFGSHYDDWGIAYVPAGITCLKNSVTATGPFLAAIGSVGSTDCTHDVGGAAYDPADTSARQGAIPFGFAINFFGTTYSGAWPNTNGGIFYDAPNSRYDRTMPDLAKSSLSSAMFPLGADLYYEPTESNFWTAQTTVDGHNAVVFSWEKFHNCCSSGAQPDDMSFQLVIIDRGSGNFDAYFNYGSMINFNQGYDAPQFFFSLANEVTVGSNIVHTRDASFASATCTEATLATTYGTPTDSVFVGALGSTVYLKLEDAGAKTISLWSDDTCATPIQPTVLQDVVADKIAYLELKYRSASFQAVASGWATYNQTTDAIDWTELLRNQDSSQLLDTGSNPLIQQHLNTTVVGRFVIGQRDGQTVTDPAALGIASAPAAAHALAPTGLDVGNAAIAAVTLGSLGLAALLFSVSNRLARRRVSATE